MYINLSAFTNKLIIISKKTGPPTERRQAGPTNYNLRAPRRPRTPALLSTKQPLYHLSYGRLCRLSVLSSLVRLRLSISQPCGFEAVRTPGLEPGRIWRVLVGTLSGIFVMIFTRFMGSWRLLPRIYPTCLLVAHFLRTIGADYPASTIPPSPLVPPQSSRTLTASLSPRGYLAHTERRHCLE